MPTEKISLTKQNPLAAFIKKHKYLSVFLLGTMMYIIAIIPVLVMRDGLFYYYGDYNYQSIEFYTFTHRAMREGFFFWHPNIEWGGSLFASLSGYSTSPFLYLLLPFPTEWVPYLLPFVMALRYGTAATTAFAWLRTITKTNRGALIGAMLYAFSGFQAINIVFTQFHDITAFFPLYLLCFDRLMQKKGWGGFTLMTALMSFMSLYHLFAEVVFFLIYYFVRYHRYHIKGLSLKDRKEKIRIKNNLKRFLSALGCGILGVCIAMPQILQSLSVLLGNSRISSTLSGEALLAYPSSTTVWNVIKSLFILPETMGNQMLFYNDDVRWASVSLFLPCVSIAGVIAYYLMIKGRRKKDWKAILVAIFALMMMIPALNALFSAFNSMYFARWFYIPILFMSCMTAEALEYSEQKNLKAGSAVSLVITVLFVLLSFFTMKYYALTLVLSLLGAVFMLYIAFGEKKEGVSFKNVRGDTIGIIAFFCVASTIGTLINGTTAFTDESAKDTISRVINNKSELDMSEYGRVEDEALNYSFYWGYPSTKMFISTPTPSTVNVLNTIGLGRMQRTNIHLKEKGLRQLLSTKYFLVNLEPLEGKTPWGNFGGEDGEQVFYKQSSALSEINDRLSNLSSYDAPANSSQSSGNQSASDIDSIADEEEEGSLVPDRFVKTGEADGFEIYENQYFIPMGFTYEYYIQNEKMKKIFEEDKYIYHTGDNLLVKDLILNDEQIEKYGHLLKEDTDAHEKPLSDEEFYAECEKRATSAASVFSYDRDGYLAKISLPKENLVFFSIPYDKGFKAYVDGVETKLERIVPGFMAVDVPEGEHIIRLYWRPYGFGLGIGVSIVGIAVMVMIFAFVSRRKKKR